MTKQQIIKQMESIEAKVFEIVKDNYQSHITHKEECQALWAEWDRLEIQLVEA